MDSDRRRTGSEEPAGWWGPFRRPPARSVLDLVREGVLDATLAGLLWAVLARRASLTVVAEPSGAGKTTLLTALLDWLPAEERRIAIRGCYEPFDFLDDPAVVPDRTTLLVNEISPHLPIYLWGPGVGRLLAAAQSGFAVMATAHARGADGLVALLAGYPLRLPADAIAGLGLVLTLEAWADQGTVRRMARELTALRATGSGGVTIDRLASRRRQEAESRLDLVGAAGFLASHGFRGDDPELATEVERRSAVIRRRLAATTSAE